MKAFHISNFAALIGIDWADQKHDICELNRQTNKQHLSIISAKPTAINAWAMSLKEKYKGQPVAVACELKKGPLIYALSKFEHIVLFTINPSTVAKYRKAFTHSGAKDDPTDAAIQVELLENHMSKLSVITPDTEKVRYLTQLVEYRRKLVQDRVNLTNKITTTLKNYYPHVLDWFKEKDTQVFCDFILRWPSLEQVKRARKQTLVDFFNQHNSRYPSVNEKRIEAIKQAEPLTTDKAIISPNLLLVECLTAQLQQLMLAIERFDIEIKTIYKTHKDRFIFDSLPGAGPQMAPRLLAAMGSNRERYQSCEEIQKYAGIAPVTERSGKKKWIHWRYSCTTFLRQTFVEWAGQSVRYSFWAKAYYKQQQEKGKPHNTIIRAVAFKWIRILFRCWKTCTAYDESKYLEALKSKGSPLLKYAVESKF
ncbi:IS110 family transposase [Thalassotalea sp. 1_MG-2023]|uniref:IS110 family transposase n=1 Tax=Thalassotalea sp. 1_MG-2023 TaxID=3062680 RepID=UPI0026E2012E|nr:IS110 family transposase [Thalassotalea sp. 1_MG-2023]MDO6428817.1 IS110 family transposase [Thalassotalea sp. 1_MG-2023]